MRPRPGCSACSRREPEKGRATVLVLRIVALLAVVAIGVCGLTWVFTGDRKYLKAAWRIFQFALAATLLFLAMLFFERLLVMV